MSIHAFVQKDGNRKKVPTGFFPGVRKAEERLHCKNIRRFYGKISGNQLSVHFPLFFAGARKHFQESGTER